MSYQRPHKQAVVKAKPNSSWDQFLPRAWELIQSSLDTRQITFSDFSSTDINTVLKSSSDLALFVEYKQKASYFFNLRNWR